MAEALGHAHTLTTIVKPSFADFGDPDRLIVANAHDGRAAALMLIEAKRGPLASEWGGNVSTKENRSKSSHLVVQTARGAAFLRELQRRSPGGGASRGICFKASEDYWYGDNGRRLNLKKTSLVQFLDDSGVCGDIPKANITLTSTAWPYRQRHRARAVSLPSDAEFSKILRRWGLEVPKPIYLGFGFLLERPDSYPLFQETFRFCGWDALGPGRDWDVWLPHAIAEFGQDTWDRVSDWANARGSLEPPSRNNAVRCRKVMKGRSPVARLFGCYGPGGPILDLQVPRSTDDSTLPEGWRLWDFGLGDAPIDNDTWKHRYLVPEGSNPLTPGHSSEGMGGSKGPSIDRPDAIPNKEGAA